MLSQYEAKKLSGDSPEKTALISRAEDLLGDMIRRFNEAGFSKVDASGFFHEIIDRKLQELEEEHEQKALFSDAQMNSPGAIGKKEAINSAIGSNKAIFLAKIKAMQEKWQALAKNDEYEETRIISPYLYNKTKRTPVNTSILSDNLEFFRDSYITEYSDHQLFKLLEIACLSGSKRVADFLLNKLGESYSSSDYQFVLCFASASFNTEWAKEIARDMAKKDISVPAGIYSSIISDEMREVIISIFDDRNKAQGRPSIVF